MLRRGTSVLREAVPTWNFRVSAFFLYHCVDDDLDWISHREFDIESDGDLSMACNQAALERRHKSGADGGELKCLIWAGRAAWRNWCPRPQVSKNAGF